MNTEEPDPRKSWPAEPPREAGTASAAERWMARTASRIAWGSEFRIILLLIAFALIWTGLDKGLEALTSPPVLGSIAVILSFLGSGFLLADLGDQGAAARARSWLLCIVLQLVVLGTVWWLSDGAGTWVFILLFSEVLVLVFSVLGLVAHLFGRMEDTLHHG